MTAALRSWSTEDKDESPFTASHPGGCPACFPVLFLTNSEPAAIQSDAREFYDRLKSCSFRGWKRNNERLLK